MLYAYAQLLPTSLADVLDVLCIWIAAIIARPLLCIKLLHSQTVVGTKVKTGNHLINLNERTTGFRYFGNITFSLRKSYSHRFIIPCSIGLYGKIIIHLILPHLAIKKTIGIKTRIKKVEFWAPIMNLS